MEGGQQGFEGGAKRRVLDVSLLSQAGGGFVGEAIIRFWQQDTGPHIDMSLPAVKDRAGSWLRDVGHQCFSVYNLIQEGIARESISLHRKPKEPLFESFRSRQLVAYFGNRDSLDWDYWAKRPLEAKKCNGGCKSDSRVCVLPYLSMLLFVHKVAKEHRGSQLCLEQTDGKTE